VDLLAMTALQFASVATTTPPSSAVAPQEVWPAEQRQEIEQLLARVQTALESRS
jgi:hypothetical protein